MLTTLDRNDLSKDFETKLVPLEGHSASWDFPVEKVPLKAVMSNGELEDVPPQFAQAIVRSDTGDTLGIHGSRYELRPYSDTVDYFRDVVENSPLNLKDVQINAMTVGMGQRLRLDIDMPTHSYDVQPQRRVGDIVNLRISFFDSYDGQWSTGLRFGARRLLCLNGMTTNAFQFVLRAKHTSQEMPKLQDALGSIEKAIHNFYEDKDKFMRLVQRELPYDTMRAYLTVNFCRRWNRKAGIWTTNENLQQRFDAMLDHELVTCGSTMWALYNTLTRWSTHGDIRSGSDKTNIMTNREQKVRELTNQPLWGQLISGRIFDGYENAIDAMAHEISVS